MQGWVVGGWGAWRGGRVGDVEILLKDNKRRVVSSPF